jgi:hypothetical protein
MKTNPVKQKLRAGRASFGTWLSLGEVHSARVLARCGFEWLTLDLEHAAVDWSQAAVIFALVAEAGCVPLARVPEGDHYCIKRALDAGAFGIVVPMVETVEQARTAIAAARYPPLGNRSVGGGMHSLNFAATADDYYRRANDAFWRERPPWRSGSRDNAIRQAAERHGGRSLQAEIILRPHLRDPPSLTLRVSIARSRPFTSRGVTNPGSARFASAARPLILVRRFRRTAQDAVFHVVDRVEQVQRAAVVRDHDRARPVLVGHLGK